MDEEEKEIEIVKVYYGKEAGIAYRLFWDETDSTVNKFIIWSDSTVSFNEQHETYPINFVSILP